MDHHDINPNLFISGDSFGDEDGVIVFYSFGLIRLKGQNNNFIDIDHDGFFRIRVVVDLRLLDFPLLVLELLFCFGGEVVA